MYEDHTKTGEVIRSMTPIEYVKVRDAADAHVKHVMDLHEFVTFMAGELGAGSMTELTPEGTDRLIDAYLSKTNG